MTRFYYNDKEGTRHEFKDITEAVEYALEHDWYSSAISEIVKKRLMEWKYDELLDMILRGEFIDYSYKEMVENCVEVAYGDSAEPSGSVGPFGWYEEE